MNIQQLYNTVSDHNKQISTILKQSGFDTHNDLYDLDCGSDPESLMLREELTDVLDRLDIVHNSIDYLNKKIAGEYTLHKNRSDRYSCDLHEFTCGNRIEFYYYDDDIEKYRWNISTVEHNGSDYYIVGYRDVALDGLKVRIRV